MGLLCGQQASILDLVVIQGYFPQIIYWTIYLSCWFSVSAIINKNVVFVCFILKKVTHKEDRLSPGVLGCSALCWSGVRTKFGINMVTSREQGTTRLPTEGWTGPGWKVTQNRRNKWIWGKW
jgi:hypothetical protein